jgi:DNA-binding transcriptional MerR regulator
LATAEKAPGALKTIGELSAELGVAQHILRYWETRFPQLKPMQRAGNRRYYRPADVDLARRINRLLNEEGYTVRGVQKLLRDRGGQGETPMMETPAAAPPAPAALQPEESREPPAEENGGVDVFRLIALRDRLQDALKD